MKVRGRRLSIASLLAPVPILIVLALLLFLPPDGNERADWMQFIGRFHPLAVHFPIALLLLVPVLELAGLSYRFDYLRLSAGFVLGLATLGATLAAILGWFLARSGGYSGPLIGQHMWGGISLAVVCWLCWILRRGSSAPLTGLAYAAALAAALVLVSWTGYRGGQLTQGENHLTEFMPAAWREKLGLARNSLPRTDANTFYAVRVEPIFRERCFSCHGPDKEKGKLRLDSYPGLMKGGKNGAAVRAGDAQASDLMRRVTLPADNDDFMPKEGKRPLSADQVKLIGLWIAAGASDTLPPDGIRDAPGPAAATVAEVTFTEIDSAAVTRQRADVAPVLESLQKRFPHILQYESRGSADLLLNASILGPRFGDSDLAALAPLAQHITLADLSRTAVSDRSASVVSAMKRLRTLRLSDTKVTDATVQGLGGLEQLESLNVFGTSVTPAILPIVEKLPKLAHLYIGQTAIPANFSVSPALTGKVVF